MKAVKEVYILSREKLTAIMSDCYSQEGSACPIHPIFQPQKAINEIISYLESAGINLVWKENQGEKK
jgi:hypothetical protein